jgi:hypothetical protein
LDKRVEQPVDALAASKKYPERNSYEDRQIETYGNAEKACNTVPQQASVHNQLVK